MRSLSNEILFSLNTQFIVQRLFSKQEDFLHDQNLPLKVPKIQKNEIQIENDIGEQKDYTSCQQHKHHFDREWLYMLCNQTTIRTCKNFHVKHTYRITAAVEFSNPLPFNLYLYSTVCLLMCLVTCKVKNTTFKMFSLERKRERERLH